MLRFCTQRCMNTLSVLAVMAAVSEPVLAQNAEVFAEGQSLSYSDSYPVSAFFDGLEGQDFRPGGDTSFTHNVAAGGIRNRHFEVAAIARYDYSVDYTPDAAFVLDAVVNEETPADDAEHIAIDINHVASFGLRLGVRGEVLPGLEVGLRVSGLYSEVNFDGYLIGNASVDDGSLDFDFTAEYIFSDDLLFDRAVQPPEGYGYAVDASLAWRPHDRVQVQLDIVDLAAAIHWNDVAYTYVDATTNTVSENANGGLSVRPTLEGRHLRGAYTQSLEPRATVQFDADVSDHWSLVQVGRVVQDVAFAETGLSRRFGDTAHVTVLAEWRTGALGASFGWRGLDFTLVSDSTDLEEARYLQASIAAKLAF